MINDGNKTIGFQSDAVTAQNERTAVLGQLAGGVAHDFNNILQVIAGSAAMIEENPTDVALVRRCARRMTLAAGRGAAISGRLLAFARRGDAQPSGEAVSIKALFESIQDLLGPLLPANVSVHAKVENELPLLLADQAQLETVLVNLATNARDAMGHGGHVTFSAGLVQIQGNDLGLKAGSYVRIAVTDNGIGMDPTTIARVMEPFFTTKPRGRGTGLGLPLAKEFALQSGGALDITSIPHVSTEVRLWLPVAISFEDAPKLMSLPIKSKSERVLVIEDDELVRETMAASLEQAGFVPIEVADGETALATLDDPALSVDVIVVDYALPGMTGVAVIREAQRCRETLPALLVTGVIGDMEVNCPIPKFGMLRKPFSPSQLVTAVASLLSET